MTLEAVDKLCRQHKYFSDISRRNLDTMLPAKTHSWRSNAKKIMIVLQLQTQRKNPKDPSSNFPKREKERISVTSRKRSFEGRKRAKDALYAKEEDILQKIVLTNPRKHQR